MTSEVLGTPVFVLVVIAGLGAVSIAAYLSRTRAAAGQALLCAGVALVFVGLAGDAISTTQSRAERSAHYDALLSQSQDEVPAKRSH